MARKSKERPIYPMVISPSHKRPRKGKGFSLGELQAVGLTINQAKKLGISIDKRRRSVHQENIELLRRFLGSTNK
ncbi:50S ribosomal protein L13e [Candidatus Geothermarchaeota archaeon]|nr:MAG: 50S ribosomal protein L13e [Candidatus Geothermarchaeota archaeon]